MALINFQDVSLSFGGPNLLNGLNIQIHEGEKISLLGRNGAGKSTMMKVIHGLVEPDSGKIFRSRDLRTSILQQDVPDGINGTVYAVLAMGIADDQEPVHHDHLDQKHIRQIERVISLMSLDPEPEFQTLSAGMKRRVLLGQALVNDPDILLLDEPTNHLDIDSIKWLEEFLVRYEKTVFFVTHDRAFLQKVAKRILEIDRGNIFDWNCDYQTFLKRKEAWLESEDVQNALFDKKLAQEEIWIRKGIKARRTRNEGRVRALKAMRSERSKRLEQQGTVKIDMMQSERSGKLVIEAENIAFGYDENLIIKNFSTTIMRGDKVGFIGPNGCGKSTMVKLLLKQYEVLSGKVKHGTKLDIAYFDQLRDQLDDNRTIRQNVTDGNEIIEFNGKSKHVIGHLQDFLFTPDRADEKVSVLSGGEKNRLMLAKLFAKPFNLLIMDEPTNDLDLETVELLEELLIEYDGTLLVVSHDREFLNNVVTSTIAFEGNGVVREYAGGYDDWLRQRTVVKEVKDKPVQREKKPAERTKMTFKEKKEFETIPDDIAAKEKRKEELVALIHDPEFYQQQAHKASEVNKEIESIDADLEALFDRWMELEDKMKNEK
ncbi:MAG TPA: ATP-binding cassette domain-containing protein [Spirochaetota bacterium]|nr:ATP-binding cassette domain-containing protein [Spirochaetota bacterium]